MRRVDAAKDFDDALESAKREAASSFGDDRVLIEKYITSPRHIEVQVFGDSHGNVVHLFERDCSLQRRHQKVIEEAPAPGMDEETRDAVCSAAVRAAKAVNYEGAGTIEFIADASEGLRADRIWFMEMNTRLQVEHAVTEEITGQDLVEWQLRVASGERLPKKQSELSITGHAIEARLYAEDPAKGFLPSTGRLDHLLLPGWIRVDTGFEEGGEITPFYDPMIAKLIVRARSREAAARELVTACERIAVWPVRTNAGFLARAAADPDFVAGRIDTGFIERHSHQLIPASDPPQEVLQRGAHALLPFPGYHVWSSLTGFRSNQPPNRCVMVEVNDKPHLVSIEGPPSPYADYVVVGDEQLVFFRGQAWVIGEPDTNRARTGTSHGLHDGEIEAPMPGKVTAVEVSQGEKVAKGQRLLTLEAMKMEHALTAPFDGTVAELAAKPGVQVTEGQLLVKVEPDA
jgi:3-methylcrotonyl-CoA carboxylase alpha subunit